MKKIGNTKICFIILVLVRLSTLSAQDIWRTVHAYPYVLTFYKKNVSSYFAATNICNNVEGTLVQLDDVNVRNAVNFTIRDSSPQPYFWIGATRNKTADDWLWVDNSMVNTSTITWYDDSNSAGKNYIVINTRGNRTNLLRNVNPGFKNAATICQNKTGASNIWQIDTSKYQITIFNVTSGSWSEASSKCNDIDSTLVQLDDAEVRDAVYNLIHRTSDSFFWIGATRRCKSCNDWTWLDSTTVNIDLIKWNSDESNNESGEEDKLVINSNLKFSDVKETFVQGKVICQKVICEKDRDGCENGGNCNSPTEEVNSCSCPPGYYGAICSYQHCEAFSNTCKNQGVCFNNITSPYFSCACISNGYYGTTCNELYCAHHPNTCGNGGQCTSTSTESFYICNCTGTGYYGDTCQEDHCVTYPNTCQNNGTCIPSTTNHFFDCTCAKNGYYGVTCNKTYCDHHEHPCNNGICNSTLQKYPFYQCDCGETGFDGDTCSRKQIQINSTEKTIGIVGGYANIDVQIETYDGQLTIVVYKSGVALQNKTGVGNGTTTFAIYVESLSDEGNYKFVAYPESKTYERNTTTYVTVHENAAISNISQYDIFSPITNGSSKVTCYGSGIPTPDVSWYNKETEVPSSKVLRNDGVYQTNQNTNAILHVQNANLMDHGTYTCRVTNIVGIKNISITAKKDIKLSVYGGPIILNIDVTPCSEKGELIVNWKPYIQSTGLVHKFLLTSVNASTELNDITHQVKGGNVTFNNLDPFTSYKILIEVCPDLCLAQLNASDIQTTGHGLPDVVKSSSVRENTDASVCVITWSQPTTPGDQITEYEVLVVETLEYTPPESGEPISRSKLYKADAQTFNYTYNTDFNRIHSFNISAKTCAGKGVAVESNGTCVSKRSAPSVVPSAILSDVFQPGPNIELTVNLPNETNGPISCSFVIVNQGNNMNSSTTFGIQQLQEAAAATASVDIFGVNYLAIAIPRENMVNGTYITSLGNGNSTSCNVLNVFTVNGRKRRSTDRLSLTYEGRNKVLIAEGTLYGVFIVTTTPTKDGQFIFQQSSVQIFNNGEAPAESLLWIIGLLVALLLVVLIGGAFYMWRRKRGNRKKSTNSQTNLPHTNGSPIRTFVPEPVVLYENVTVGATKSDTDIMFPLLQDKYRLLKANESMLFREQFQVIKQKSKNFAPPSIIGSSEAMIPKNRYKNIHPYDSTRVVLNRGDGYINACYITGEKKYIASQGPLTNTMNDFWRMVLEQKCHVIVMLTKCDEAGRRKCEKYWPDLNEAMQFEDFYVENEKEIYYGGYVKRTLKMFTAQQNGYEVIQYQFLKWPDHGVPATTSDFFRLHKAVMESYDTRHNGPLLVHCSAGVGRTGTFIGYDMLCKEKQSVDFLSCVLSMRKQRVEMVQTCEQYGLLHKLILERYLFGETDVTEEEIRENRERGQRIRNNKSIEQEFLNLDVTDLLDSRKTENNSVQRNRVVIIRQPEDTEWISIDASYLEAYDMNTHLIAAQSPRNSTVEYFLRAILDNNIDTIVMLDKSCPKNSEQDEDVRYWPLSAKDPLILNNIAVYLDHQRQTQDYVERKFIVSRNKHQQQKTVTQYHCINWESDRAIPGTNEILGVISALRRCTNNVRTSVVLVHCSDGIGKSGVLCALLNLFKRAEKEKKIDVFRAVKDLRDLRPGMVQTLDQYKLCYEVVQEYLSEDNAYENPAMVIDEEPVYQNVQR